MASSNTWWSTFGERPRGTYRKLASSVISGTTIGIEGSKLSQPTVDSISRVQKIHSPSVGREGNPWTYMTRARRKLHLSKSSIFTGDPCTQTGIRCGFCRDKSIASSQSNGFFFDSTTSTIFFSRFLPVFTKLIADSDFSSSNPSSACISIAAADSAFVNTLGSATPHSSLLLSAPSSSRPSARFCISTDSERPTDAGPHRQYMKWSPSKSNGRQFSPAFSCDRARGLFKYRSANARLPISYTLSTEISCCFKYTSCFSITFLR
mmetsp:Transcript_26311/g.66359  ORF Transcript_26311/g.66359 Transcript_26311/m.66359 type:complete len:264 (+) Transcript_26311:726-1517(+)